MIYVSRQNDTAFVADGGDQPDTPPDRSGVAVVRPDGSVIERFGRWGNYDGQFEMAHAVAVAGDGSVYVADITGGRVQKVVGDGQQRPRRGPNNAMHRTPRT